MPSSECSACAFSGLANKHQCLARRCQHLQLSGLSNTDSVRKLVSTSSTAMTGNGSECPFSGVQSLAESSFAFTNNIDARHDSHQRDRVTQVTAFVDAMDLKRVIIAVSNQATYDPFA